jgi:hypothetical protein
VSPRIWLLLAWILVGAALLVVHAVVLWQLVRVEALARRWRVLGLLVPPAAPIVLWVGGGRVAPALWLLAVLGYVVLRAME